MLPVGYSVRGKRGETMTPSNRETKEGETPSPATQTRIQSFSFGKGVDCRSFLRLVFCGRPLYFAKERRCVLNRILNVISLQTLSSCEIKRIIRGIVANYKYQDHR